MRPALLAYDVFCMVFLDRQGSYYKKDQRRRLMRGSLTTQKLIHSLRRYQQLRLFDSQQQYNARPDGDPHDMMKHDMLGEWWYAEQETRALVARRIEAQPCTGEGEGDDEDEKFDWTHKDFLRSFHRKPTEYDDRQFFITLSQYVALLLSPAVTLQPVPGLPSPYNYGVYMLRSLSLDRGTGPGPRNRVKAVAGDLVTINDEEWRLLKDNNADHSVMEMYRAEMRSTQLATGTDADRDRDRRHDRRAQGKPAVRPRESAESTAHEQQLYVVTGGVAFINHACIVHSHVYPCVFELRCTLTSPLT